MLFILKIIGGLIVIFIIAMMALIYALGDYGGPDRGGPDK